MSRPTAIPRNREPIFDLLFHGHHEQGDVLAGIHGVPAQPEDWTNELLSVYQNAMLDVNPVCDVRIITA
jgi:hypothetical protein